jgi:DUF4097 and DUF4098 domain-containing protein YvlB
MKASFKYLVVMACAFMLVMPSVAMAEGDVSSVNKSIRIDDDSSAGKVDSVNGSIRIGANSVVESVDSVNGSIKLSENVKVEQGIESVNGSVTLESGGEVDGNVETINGSIKLLSASVAGDIETINGSIRLLEGTEVTGNVLVKKSKGWSWNKKRNPVKVEIGENVKVHGDLIFEHDVELKLHDSAQVGEIIGDKVTMIDS